MDSLGYRRALPLVLDEVHRRTVAARFMEAGLSVQTGMWAELEELEAAYYDQDPELHYVLSDVEYDGVHTFGPVFGNEHYLVMSEPAVSAFERYHRIFKLGSWAMHRQILIEDSVQPVHSTYYCSRILIMPDSPPLAIHGDDCRYVTNGGTWCGSDAGLVNAVRDAFGPDAVEHISEDVARRVTDALLQDTARITTSKS